MHPLELTKCSHKSGDAKFRLRTLSDEFEVIYDRYFQRRTAKVISWIQLVCGTLLLLVFCQILIHPSYGARSLFTLTTPFAIVAIFLASILTLVAAKTSSYGKLHLAMTFHIVCLVLNYIFVTMALNHEFPRLRAELDSLVGKTLVWAYPSPHNDYEDSGSSYDSYFTTTPRPNSITAAEFEETSRILKNGLSLTAALVTGMTIQGVLSFIMSIMTGRAICYGRSNLEGKFFEVETVSSDHPELLSPVRRNAPDLDDHLPKRDPIKKSEDVQPVEITRIGVSPPPPYESDKDKTESVPEYQTA